MFTSRKSSLIRKAVFPIAGIGSRFLPITLAVPKEMIPIIDVPLLHFAVAEALEAGIDECVFVVSPDRDQQRVIEDYFCDNGVLERRLQAAGKGDQAVKWREMLPMPEKLSFLEQDRPLGLGHAIWLTRTIVGNESFAVLLPDELLFSRPGCLSRLTEAYGNGSGGFLLAMQHVSRDSCGRYGMLDIGTLNEAAVGAETVALHGVKEKPAPEDAPSTLAIIGRYILPAAIFSLLKPSGKLRDGEDVLLTDALGALIAEGTAAHGLLFEGERFDCGHKEGFLAAIVASARKRDDLGAAFNAMLVRSTTGAIS